MYYFFSYPLFIFLDVIITLTSERDQIRLLYIFSRHFFYLFIFLTAFNAGRALQLSSYIVLTTLRCETPKLTDSSVISKGPMHALLHSVPPTLQQATADPSLCQRLLDTHWQPLLGSLLLSPGAHKVLFVPSQSLFPQSCVSSEKSEEPEIELPTSAGSSKKQQGSRKTSISALLTMPKPLTMWITTKCGKFLKK